MKKIYFLILGALIFFYSIFIEPNILNVEHITFTSKKVPKIRIVFLTDFHLNKNSKKRLQRIVDKVNKLDADIIISGGDFVFAHDVNKTLNLDIAGEILSKCKSKYGFYTVLGNHDSYKDGETVKNTLKKYGIVILENSSEKITTKDGKSFYLAGISDMQTTYYDLEAAMKNTKPPVILVSHTPDIAPYAKDEVELILSGHLHGGQVSLPFFGALYLPSRWGKTYEKGLIDNMVYVSRGLGQSILPIRFNCPPEITVIDYK